MLEGLNKRNTETVQSKLIEQDKMIRDQEIRINSMHQALSSMSEKLNALEMIVQIQKVRMVGTGASVI